MTENALPFLDQEGMTETPEPEAVQAEPAPAPIQPEGETATPPVAQAEEPRHIPITALLDEREKRQAKEREAEELRRKLAEYEARQQQQPEAPDPLVDPQAWQAHLQAQVEQKVLNERLNTSEELARDKYGDEVVDAARDAFMAAAQHSPTLAVELRRARNPYRYVVEWHKQQQLLTRVGPDPDAFINAEVERRLAERLAAAAPVQPNRPAAPPRSLAAAPAVASGSESKTGGFDALFGG